MTPDEPDEDDLCPHDFPPEFCGVCHEEDEANTPTDESEARCPCPSCTRTQ